MPLGQGPKVEIGLSATTITSQEAKPPRATDDNLISQRPISPETRHLNPQYVTGWRLHVLTFR